MARLGAIASIRGAASCQMRHGPRRKSDRDACEPSAACCSCDRSVVRGPRVRTLLHRHPRSVSNPSMRWARSDRYSGWRPPLHRQFPCELAHSGSGLAPPTRPPRVPSSPPRTAQHQPRPSSLWFPLEVRFRQRSLSHHAIVQALESDRKLTRSTRSTSLFASAVVAAAPLVQVVVAELIERLDRTGVVARRNAHRVGQRKRAHEPVRVAGRVNLTWHRRIAGRGQ